MAWCQGCAGSGRSVMYEQLVACEECIGDGNCVLCVGEGTVVDE